MRERPARTDQEVDQGANTVLILTFIMTENFPIPLRMLYQIPAERRTGVKLVSGRQIIFS